MGKNVKYKEIQSFFKMNFEKAIELFYNSQDFEKYANDPKTKYLDKEFKAQKGFSLLEPNGFIKMVKQYEKKLKKESIWKRFYIDFSEIDVISFDYWFINYFLIYFNIFKFKFLTNFKCYNFF